MKKGVVALLVSMGVVFAGLCIICYLYSASAKIKEECYARIKTAKGTVDSLAQLPQKLEIECKDLPGAICQLGDFTITLPGFSDADINVRRYPDDSYIYSNGKDKFVYLGTQFINIPSLRALFEKAAGKKFSNQYALYMDSLYCTPDDFTLLDIYKNKSVSFLLLAKNNFLKYRGHPYYFDNGSIKGFLFFKPSENRSEAVLVNSAAPDVCYQVNFRGFSLEELKEILGTVSFNGEAAR